MTNPAPVSALLSNYGGNLVLQALLGQSGLYLACHTSSPTALGLLDTEVGGAGYVRQPVAFSVPAARSVANTVKAYYSSMPDVVVTWLAVWDASAAGHFLVALELAQPITVDETGQLRVEIGDVAFAF